MRENLPTSKGMRKRKSRTQSSVIVHDCSDERRVPSSSPMEFFFKMV